VYSHVTPPPPRPPLFPYTTLFRAQVQAAVENAAGIMGGLEVVINNAGISIRHPCLDITAEEWNKVIAVNLTGVFYVAQTAARHMMRHDGGVILQTASTNGIMGYP